MASKKDANDQPHQEKSRRYGLPFDALLNIPGLATQTIGKAISHSGSLLGMLLKTPDYMEQVGKAGHYLKDLREVAGLTLDDLAKAVDLKNPDILKSVEEGRSPITIDILFRLSSFYSRNDPFAFMFNFSREYAPWLWQALRITGMEKLLITMERELKFINVYRARESARHLSDEDFDKMLTFVSSGFNMAMDFIEPEKVNPKGRGKKAKAASDDSMQTEEPADPEAETTGKITGKPRQSPAKKPAAKRSPAKK